MRLRALSSVLAACALAAVAPLAIAARGAAPSPPPGPTARSADLGPGLACAAIVARVDDALARPEAEIGRADHDAIFLAVREGARAGAPARAEGCGARLYGRLASVERCGRAADALAAGLFGAAGAAPSEVAAAVRAARPACRAPIAEAAGFASDVDASLVAALRQVRDEAARGRDPDGVVEYRVAWLALGSLEETAARRGRAEVRAELDREIAGALAEASGPRELLLLRAAGNGGCVGCLPKVRARLDARDATVRRAAAAALRFVDDADAVRRMCARLAADADVAVRDTAAWALHAREGSAAERAACLELAARRDGEAVVRQQATQSLGLLAYHDERARDGIVRLVDAPHPEVASLALGVLRAEGERQGASDVRGAGER